MAGVDYLDFDLRIERREGKYRARVSKSPAGEAQVSFALPASDLEGFEELIGPTRGVRRDIRRRRRATPEAAEVVKAFGGRLFEAIFGGEVRARLRTSLDEAGRQGAGLRIRLHLTDVPEFANLPWEYLYDSALNRFLVLSRRTPLVRYPDLPELIQPLAVKPPLRVLVMISSPKGYPRLNVGREWNNLKHALGDLERRGLVTLERLDEATLPVLQRRLRRGEYHVFHFIGHGDFDEQTQDGVLLLEDEHEQGHPVSGEYLATLMYDEDTLRLAILNACEGARTSRRDPFAGTAQSLVRRGGVPAVIAMQFGVTDEAAITFAQEFYAAVADGYPVDAALAEARKAIYRQGHGVEWGAPVLYMRSPDGRIFDVERLEEEAPTPPAELPEAVKHNLPVPLTSFIGREREMAEVRRLLPTTHLLTLTGPAGCGKTRLALEVARGVVDERSSPLRGYADGVWLVELAALEDAALVPQEIAEVLGVREEPDRELTETLADYLRPRELLLVLDNCEHLVEACARFANVLLRCCSRLRLLATSREALNIRGEVAWGVPSLSLPDPHALPAVEQLTASEAVRLFVDRARSRQPGFALTERNALATARICRRLDGIPLAIELAAALVKVLSVGQIAAKLDDCFRLLTEGRRGALPHHQTLRAAVDWSYDLLNAAERNLFNRLAVFAGGFTLEAAGAVSAASGASAGEEPSTGSPAWRPGQAGQAVEEYDVLHLLSRLVDKSLVVAEGAAGDTRRYRLLETLRQYGKDRLAASGAWEATRRRHAAYFLALAEEAEPELTGPEQAAWLDRLETEHDNLRAALRWVRESGEAETGLRLAGALWRFWYVRGYYREGRERLEGILGLPGAAERTAARAKALYGGGVLCNVQGDRAAARPLFEESVVIRRELGDKRGTAISLNGVGVVAHDQGDYEAARSLFGECLALFRELGDRQGMATSLNNLGNVAKAQGDYATARGYHEESLAIRRELGDKQGIATSLHNLGNLVHEQGEYASARALHEESLAMFRELGDRGSAAYALKYLGDVTFDQGEYTTARSLFSESLAEQRALHDKAGIAYSLEAFVRLAAAQARWERALCLAGAAAALRGSIGAPLLPDEQARLERYLELARQSLGAEASARALANGRAMTLEQAITYAVEGTS